MAGGCFKAFLEQLICGRFLPGIVFDPFFCVYNFPFLDIGTLPKADDPIGGILLDLALKDHWCEKDQNTICF